MFWSIDGHGRRNRHATAEDRFWAKVIRSDHCWIWRGGCDKRGYGRFLFRGRVVVAARAAWELFVGPIPENLWILHRCDNPPCVNPAHLFLGTAADNVRDMMNKRRHISVMCPERLARGNRSGSRMHPESRPRGEKNKGAKLTWEVVDEIRLAEKCGVTQRALAARFGVRQSTVWQILRGRTWKDSFRTTAVS